MHDDTSIVALATSAGPAARCIIRTSGRDAFAFASQTGASDLRAGEACGHRLCFAGMSVCATCYAFRRPRSHTGENVVEYHLPGNPLLARLLIESLIRLGARQAQPGEFSARAFFNGKIRLDEAEGIAAVISANNDRELSAARRLRAGELARRLEPIMDDLADLLALCELGIDFTEEEVVVLAPAEANRRIAAQLGALRELLEHSPRLEQLGLAPRIALVGRPNAGKSTLLNALAGYRRAVTFDQPGTTRDALAADVELPGGSVTLIDLAGLGQSAVDAMDAEGQRRALQEAQRADLLVLLRDQSSVQADPVLPRPLDLIVGTKADLPPAQGAATADLTLSVVTGEGLAELRQRLSDLAFGSYTGTEALALSTRHRERISAAIARLEEAAGEAASSQPAGEVLALHLREALDALGAIIGTVSPDELLGRIFGRFCIGK